MSGMDAIIKEFLAESAENLDQLDRDFVTLEKEPNNREVFARVFRTIHTIKGTCGFLAFGTLEEVTHVGESVLSHLRDGKLELRPDITAALLAMVDAVREILNTIEETGREGNTKYASVITELHGLDREANEKKKAPEPDGNPVAAQKQTRIDLVPEDEPEQSSARPTSHGKVPPQKTRSEKNGKGADTTSPVPVSGPECLTTEIRPDAPVVDRVTETGSGVEVPSVSAFGESSLRVDVAVLDHLMNLVGELVLARNQILPHADEKSDPAMAHAAQRLNGITSELQEAVMKTRMQPISVIWSKLPRFVRDLSTSFGKDVTIDMDGEGTELDKSVIEAIKGSLLHLVRNAIDHGIEPSEKRLAAGKSAAGKLRLRARHEGGNVVIEVSDDGGGIDHQKVLDHGLEVGLVTRDEADRLETKQIESLIFRPGFSTARKVTNVSGRGVGLDIVMNNIQAIGGTVEIQSEPGTSTTFRMKIPLTLAIIPVVLVFCRGQRFAVPQVGVVELVHLDTENESLGIEDLNGVPVYRLRGQLLPLLYLDHELGFDAAAHDRSRGVTIVVLHGEDRRFGLVVDGVENSQEIVVKPLGRLLSGLPYAGTTILGDGGVALILDIVRLGLAAGVVSENRTHLAAEDAGEGYADGAETTTLLYLQGLNDERMAIPFAHVTRLEFIPWKRIERVAGLPVVQYRNEILQLVMLDETLPERRQKARMRSDVPETDAVQVVVCTIDGHRIGIAVHRILDIIRQSIEVTRPASREGVASCVVIQDRVTEILNLRALIRLSDPEFFDRTGADVAEGLP